MNTAIKSELRTGIDSDLVFSGRYGEALAVVQSAFFDV
jgi:hypothetical protein